MSAAASPTDPAAEPASTTGDAAVAALAALARTVAQVPGGTVRPGQQEMARTVAEGIAGNTHVAVEAPTGVGKSLGYLVPAVVAERDGPVVVATATKALQEQLVTSDLPRLQDVVPELTWAIAKGRANYLCAARLDHLTSQPDDGALFEERVDPDAWQRLRMWAARTETGDRADAPDGVGDGLWSQVSVSSAECPGARRCAFGDVCFAEHAKEEAAAADVVVTNQHLLLLDAALDGALLPPAAVTVVDEAHRLVDTAGSVFGVTLAAGRLRWLARRARPVVDDAPADGLAQAAEALSASLTELAGTGRVDPRVAPLAGALEIVEAGVEELARQVRGVSDEADPADGDEEGADRTRRQIVAGALATLRAEVAELREHDPDTHVAWVEAADRGEPQLRLAPIDVAGALRAALLSDRVCVLTSATLTVGGRFEPTLARLGVRTEEVRTASVESPFDHARQGRLYVPRHLPEPRDPAWEQHARELTLRLVQAAGGRSLVLFTSWRRLHETADWLADRVDVTLLRQGQAPPARLVERFRADETSVLCATATFWEGVDAPGRACVQVIIDKLPFPHREDPLTAARREHVRQRGGSPFHEVDLPVAAVRLAQGVGRLIRSTDDAGVVAVLDPRLATARYRQALLASMPPLRRTVDTDEVIAFLAAHLSA